MKNRLKEKVKDKPKGKMHLTPVNIKLPPRACPECGKVNDGAMMQLDNKGDRVARQPIEGDATMCAYCGSVNIFNKDLSLRPVKEEDWNKFPQEMQAFLILMVKLIKLAQQIGRKDKVKEN